MYAFCVQSNLCLAQGHKDFLPFSSIKFLVLPSTFNHHPFLFVVVYVIRYELKAWVVFCFNGCPIVPILFFKQIVCFHWITLALLLKINWSLMHGSPSRHSSLPLTHVSVFAPIAHCFDCSFTVSLEIGQCKSSNVFFFKISNLYLHISFLINLSFFELAYHYIKHLNLYLF